MRLCAVERARCRTGPRPRLDRRYGGRRSSCSAVQESAREQVLRGRRSATTTHSRCAVRMRSVRRGHMPAAGYRDHPGAVEAPSTPSPRGRRAHAQRPVRPPHVLRAPSSAVSRCGTGGSDSVLTAESVVLPDATSASLRTKNRPCTCLMNESTRNLRREQPCAN